MYNIESLGGLTFNMMTFNKMEEAAYFCKHLNKKNNYRENIYTQQKRRKMIVQLHGDIPVNEIVLSLQAVFHEFRFYKTIHQMIQQQYLFEKYDDIKEIIRYTSEIITNEQQMGQISGEDEKLDDMIFTLLKRGISTQENFSFDSAVSHILDEVGPILIETIGLAIDEWKKDLHYDYFFQSLRKFISWQPIKMNELHIIQEKNFIYYQEDGNRYDLQKLREVINRSLIYVVGLTDNEWNISPIIALAPKNIYIYGDDETDANVTTILNLYDKRAYFLPKQLFPFYAFKEQ